MWMGHIQRIDRAKPWRARFRAPDGREQSRSFKRKVDAERWLRDQEGKADRGLWTDPAAAKVPLAEYAEAWLAGRQLAPKTLEGYRSLLASRVFPEFGEWEIRAIQPDDVRAWVAKMVDEGLSASRIKQAQSLLASILKQAVADGVLARNAAQHVSTPQKRPRRQKFLTPDQIEALALACEKRQEGAGGLVTFLAWSGLRWGEATALRWSDVDLDKRRVRVRRAYSEVGGRLVEGEPKTHEHRTVIVQRHALPNRSSAAPDRGKPAGQNAKAGAPADRDHVFTAPKGGPLRSANFRKKVWLPSVAEVGLEGLVVHDLRDTAASLAISTGATIKAVQRMLGHASAAMTLDTYGGLYDEDLENLADRLEALAESYDGTETAQTASGTVTELHGKPSPGS